MKVNLNSQEKLFDPEKICKEYSGVYLGINQHQQIIFGTLGYGKSYPAEVTKKQEKAQGENSKNNMQFLPLCKA